jgi:hypothetical protein
MTRLACSGPVKVFPGTNAAGKSLAAITMPLTATDQVTRRIRQPVIHGRA